MNVMIAIKIKALKIINSLMVSFSNGVPTLNLNNHFVFFNCYDVILLEEESLRLYRTQTEKFANLFTT